MTEKLLTGTLSLNTTNQQSYSSFNSEHDLTWWKQQNDLWAQRKLDIHPVWSMSNSFLSVWRKFLSFWLSIYKAHSKGGCPGWSESSLSAQLIWAAKWKKATNWVCAKRRLRLAWASPHSDQSSLCAQWVAKVPNFLRADCEDWSDWMDAQADLCLPWAHTHFVGFVMLWLIFGFVMLQLTLLSEPGDWLCSIAMVMSWYGLWRWESYDSTPSWTGLFEGHSTTNTPSNKQCTLIFMLLLQGIWNCRLRDQVKPYFVCLYCTGWKQIIDLDQPWKILISIPWRTQTAPRTHCHSICTFWTHYSIVEPSCSNIRVITATYRVSENLEFLQ